MRFLFVTWDGGGNVPPTLALGRRLVQRGHRVRVLGPCSLRARVEAASCGFAAYERLAHGSPANAGRSRLGRWQATLLPPELARAAPALAFAEDVLAELARSPADALAVDFMLAGAVAAAERAGLPTAALMHVVYCLPAPGRPPFGSGLAPRSGSAGRVRDAGLFALVRRANRRALADLNEARRRIGLGSVDSASDQLARVARVLVLTSEAFDRPPAALPPNVRYVGPQLDDGQGLERHDRWPMTGGGEPLVVVSFSSRFAAADVVQRVVDTLGALRVRVLLTLGPALAPGELRLPANVDVRRFLPHGAVLPRSRLVVTHAGLGTVMAALADGVPLVCVPLKNDQFENAARVVAAGAGVRLRRSASRRALRGAILEVLTEPRFAEAAQRLAGAIAADRERGLAELEALAVAPSSAPSPPGPARGERVRLSPVPMG